MIISGINVLAESRRLTLSARRPVHPQLTGSFGTLRLGTLLPSPSPPKISNDGQHIHAYMQTCRHADMHPETYIAHHWLKPT